MFDILYADDPQLLKIYIDKNVMQTTCNYWGYIDKKRNADDLQVMNGTHVPRMNAW